MGFGADVFMFLEVMGWFNKVLRVFPRCFE
jgi:hypothetical protein